VGPRGVCDADENQRRNDDEFKILLPLTSPYPIEAGVLEVSCATRGKYRAPVVNAVAVDTDVLHGFMTMR
jgi:hypothetical protein